MYCTRQIIRAYIVNVVKKYKHMHIICTCAQVYTFTELTL